MAAVVDSSNMADQDLIRRWIEPHPQQPGRDEVWVREHGVPVWALVGYLRAVGSIEQVAHDYRLPVEAVQAALAYYRCHREVIDARLEANAAV